MSSHKGQNGFSRPKPERTKRNSQQHDQVEKNPRAKSSLLEREEEYKRLNAELEAKTAELVREAEAIMTEQENFLLQSSPNQTYEKDDYEMQLHEETDNGPGLGSFESLSLSNKFGLSDMIDDNENDGPVKPIKSSSKFAKNRTVSAKLMSKPLSARLSNRKTISASGARPKSQGGRQNSNANPRKLTSAADEVAIPDDFTSNLNFEDAISNIEKNLGENYSARSQEDDVMPAAAVEMGSEAQIRFLKAKLRVMQEELESLSKECHSGVEERKKLNLSLKNAMEEQARLQKTNNVQQTQIEKHKKLLEEEKKKSESVGTQVQTLRKELESMKREQRQSAVSHNATEVRLNRALEDIERYKIQSQKDKHSTKESADQDRREMERLRSDNKRLERLKTDMSTVFKKQQKLISILKRQILHIEAAKLLSFTEEEFVKALDWGSK